MEFNTIAISDGENNGQRKDARLHGQSRIDRPIRLNWLSRPVVRRGRLRVGCDKTIPARSHGAGSVGYSRVWCFTEEPSLRHLSWKRRHYQMSSKAVGANAAGKNHR